MRVLFRIGENIRKILLFITEFSRDMYLYFRYCGVSPFQDWRKKTYYKLIIETHAIEKGMSLAHPRLLFGRQKIPAIISYVRRLGLASNDMPVLMAIGALTTYHAIHRNAGVSDPLLDTVAAFLKEREAVSQVAGNGGLRTYPEGASASDGAQDWLLTSRFSCRMFAKRVVEPEMIAQVTAVAQTAPSQCNRQATKLHFYTDAGMIADLLNLQGGSAGFVQDVPGLALVSFDLAAWGGAQQRNQGYVDASLFAMNFLLAAHARGLACCPLNLAVRHSTESRIKMLGGLPVDQRVVMMIAVGWPPAGPLKAAASPRRPVSDVLTFVNGRG